jgi:hypothetical protein
MVWDAIWRFAVSRPWWHECAEGHDRAKDTLAQRDDHQQAVPLRTFIEGFEIADLREASELLSSLP